MKRYCFFLFVLCTAFAPAHIHKVPSFEKMDALFPKHALLQSLFTKPSKQPSVFLDTLRHMKATYMRPEFLPLFNIKQDDSDKNITLDLTDSLFAVGKIIYPHNITGYIVYIKGAYYNHPYSVYLILFNNTTHKPACPQITLLEEFASDGGFYRQECWVITPSGEGSPSILVRKGGGSWYGYVDGKEESQPMQEGFSIVRWNNACMEETTILNGIDDLKKTYQIPEMENY